jgi:hypothetical protein
MNARHEVVAVLDAPPPGTVRAGSEVLCVWCGRVSALGPSCALCGSPMEGSPPVGPPSPPPTILHGFDTETLMRVPVIESPTEQDARRARLRAARRRWLQR